MTDNTKVATPVDDEAGDRCAYLIDRAPDGRHFCGAAHQPASAYCPAHRALCYLRPGSRAEAARLREFEALAGAAGGRQPGPAPQPPDAWLHRLERLGRAASRPNRSPIVQEESMTASPRSPVPARRSEETAPTPERLAHGPVERLAQPIPDAQGRPARPYRSVDTLAIMERRGSITPAMRRAGEDFRARFAVAQLDPLRAIDLSHLRLGERGPRPDSAGPGLRVEAARRAVWRSLQAVGGTASPAGSCLWHVVGWERPLKEWALRQGWNGRRVSPEAAAGILIAALGALESHFGGREIL
jgi:hypothetical protein